MISLEKLLRQYKESDLNYKLPVILGENENGKPEFADLTELKHILIAGSTGSGKSLFEHSIISTFLKLFSVEQVKLLLVDMKAVEFPFFHKGVPLLLAPVQTENQSVLSGFQWINNEKNIRLKRGESELRKLPYIVVIIDTFSDLICNDPREFKDLIRAILDKGAEVKIHFIMCDSRPSLDVFTNFIRASFPTKICFNVSSAIDSKMAINTTGGEKLLGKGDMLLLKKGKHRPIHLQAPFISEKEIKEIVNRAKKIKIERFMICHAFIIDFFFKKYMLHLWVKPFWSISCHRKYDDGKKSRLFWIKRYR